MRKMLGSRRYLYLTWALLLVAALSFTGAEASAMHSSCEALCVADCGGSCRRAVQSGCSCFWICSDGTTGSSICTA